LLEWAQNKHPILPESDNYVTQIDRKIGLLPDLRSQRVTVTGATGFLGGHVLRQLKATNATVIAVNDRHRAISRHAVNPDVETVWFDQPDELARIVRSTLPNYVIHLHAAITTARDQPALEQTVRVNLLPSVALMIACNEMKLKRLILMGSGEEFGLVTGRFDDHSNANPPSPYGASKAAVTCYAKMFSNAFQLPVVVLRPSVIYGPYQAPRMLIPQVMHSLLAGKEIAVTAGMQTRDFIHVDDVARGIVSALTVSGIDGRSWNLGSGEVVTVKDCLSRIEAITGLSGLIRYGAIPYKAGETFTYEPLVNETYVAFGWRPCISLDDGLASTWAVLKDSQPARSNDSLETVR
jgi:nucleoside-diphosphate-sugar epimerase